MTPRAPNVAAIRRRLGLTQRAFASTFGMSLPALRHWEYAQRVPRGPAAALLAVIEAEPEMVARVLGRKASASSKPKGRRR
jgi:putative transcriptional regulator